MAVITQTELINGTGFVNLGQPSVINGLVARTYMYYGKITGVENPGQILVKAGSDSVGGPRWQISSTFYYAQLITPTSGSNVLPAKASANNSVVFGEWANHAISWDGVTAVNLSGGGKTYKDGVENTGNGGSGSSPWLDGSGFDMLLFNRGDGTRALLGSHAYVAVWNRVLSDAEVAQAYADGPLSVPSGLVLCWANGQDYSVNGITPTSRSAFVAGELPPNTALGTSTPGDTTAPIITNPQRIVTGATTAEGAATTDEGNGLLYYLATQNATETAATIKAANHTVDVIMTGVQVVYLTGLTPSTTYYLHFLHRDAAGNDSNILTSASFTTDAGVAGEMALVTAGDSFNAHPVSSVIVSPESATPTVNITVRVVYSNWRQFLFKLTSALDKRPLFKINNPDNYVSTFNSAWRPWYSYDGINWLRFDTAPVNNTTSWDFQHSAAFVADNVWVSYQLAWPVSRAPWLIQQLQTLNSSLIHEIPSAPGFEYPTALTAQTNELGAAVPSQKMYGLGIWDSALSPLDGSAKRIVVITGGVHAGEHYGNWAMEGFLRFLVGGTAQAITCLRNYKFYVYPLLNPMGRYMGHYRGQRDPASLTLDPNRDYPVDNSPSLLQSSTFFRNMLATDLGVLKAAFTLDFHGTWGSSTSFYYYSDISVDANAIYVDEWHARLQAYSTGYSRMSSVLDTTVDQYVGRMHGAKHSYTPEMYESSAFAAGMNALYTIGADYAKALSDSPLSEMNLPATLTGQQIGTTIRWSWS